MEKLIAKSWWKILAVAILIYTIIGGFLFDVPRLIVLNESIRNLHFHVPMWFGMIILLLISVVYAIKTLRSGSLINDLYSIEFANAGILFGVLGIISGMLWANFTWGTYWSGDPKQNASAIGLLIYFAYLILRNSMNDRHMKARISAIYNIFAFACLIPLLFILPRLTESLHPGNGGNPGFNSYDLDSNLRKVFYVAIIGWTLLGVWVATLKIRLRKLELRKNEFI